MKKFAIAAMTAVMAFSFTACGSTNDTAATAATEAATVAATVAEEAAEAATEAATELTGPQDATYTIYNVTGETVTSVTITDQADNTVVASAENLDADASTELSITVDAAEIESKQYTLAIETESGYQGAFETLHFETVPISLIAADAMTGATQIAFSIPQ